MVRIKGGGTKRWVTNKNKVNLKKSIIKEELRIGQNIQN